MADDSRAESAAAGGDAEPFVTAAQQEKVRLGVASKPWPAPRQAETHKEEAGAVCTHPCSCLCRACHCAGRALDGTGTTPRKWPEFSNAVTRVSPCRALP
jgi:hypothetical protein